MSAPTAARRLATPSTPTTNSHCRTPPMAASAISVNRPIIIWRRWSSASAARSQPCWTIRRGRPPCPARSCQASPPQNNETADTNEKPRNSFLLFRRQFVKRAARRLTEQRARLDLHARTHGGGDRHALDVGALGAGGFCLGDRVRERLDVLHQLFFGE